jgi:asparagine N-glycosylation enzyme membrane subunit Stt3
MCAGNFRARERSVYPIRMSRPSRPLAALGTALLGALALWARGSERGAVFEDGLGFARTGDAAYHLHRALATLERFPEVPAFDPLMNWPHGAYSHWVDGFDRLLALFALVLGAQGDPARASRILVWAPIALGIGGWVVTLWAARRLYAPSPLPRGVAFATGTIAAFLPVSLRFSSVGMLDHHVAEVLVVALLLGWSLARVTPPGAATARPGFRWELAGALCIAASLDTANVCFAYVVPVAAALLVAALVERGLAQGRLVGSGAPAFAIAAPLTAMLYMPSLLQHGQWFSFQFPSLMFPLLLLVAASAIAGACVAARVWPSSATESVGRLLLRRTAPFGAFAAVAALVVSQIDALARPFRAALLGHMLRGDPSLSGVDEAMPLLVDGLRWPLHHLGYWALCALVLVPVGVRHLLRVSRGRALLLLACLAWALLLALVQQRFVRGLAPLIAIGCALGLHALFFELPTPRLRRIAPLGFVACVLVLSLGHDAVVRRVLPAAPSVPPAVVGASLYLAQHNPPRAHGPRSGTRRGVLTHWGLGHFMMWPARSGVIANGYLYAAGADGFDLANRALSGDVAGALAVMDARDLGFLVTGAEFFNTVRIDSATRAFATAPDGRGVVNGRFVAQLPLAVTLLAGSAVPPLDVPHAAQLAPRWASADHLSGMAAFVPALWVYERVAGARLTGTAPPGGRVHAQLDLSVRGHALPYVAYADADAGGRFELVLPLSTERSDGTVRTGARWRVVWPDGSVAELALREADVITGARVPISASATP